MAVARRAPHPQGAGGLDGAFCIRLSQPDWRLRRVVLPVAVQRARARALQLVGQRLGDAGECRGLGVRHAGGDLAGGGDLGRHHPQPPGGHQGGAGRGRRHLLGQNRQDQSGDQGVCGNAFRLRPEPHLRGDPSRVHVSGELSGHGAGGHHRFPRQHGFRECHPPRRLARRRQRHPRLHHRRHCRSLLQGDPRRDRKGDVVPPAGNFQRDIAGDEGKVRVSVGGFVGRRWRGKGKVVVLRRRKYN